MLNPFLSGDQQAIVVFLVWKSLVYWKRMLLSFGCILFGLLLQYFLPPNYFWWGVPFILAGNLFLVVRGYDNRIKFDKYTPEAAWEQVDEGKLMEAERLAKKMRKWDRSMLDVSNGLGGFIFVVLCIIFFGMYIIAVDQGNFPLFMLGIDAAVLLIPHWLTGTRSAITKPKLLLKIKVIKKLLNKVKERLQNHEVEYLMLLKGKEEMKIPEDVKFRINIQHEAPNFLGFYGQIVTNKVKNKTYPYFYVVLVAKKGYGLKEAFDNYFPSRRIIKEFKKEGDVEVLVIRQHTTKTSGYHTGRWKRKRILLEGLELAETAAVK